MADLQAWFEGLGFAGVRTLAVSGNVIFAGGGPAAALEARLERASAQGLGMAAEFHVRSAAEWDAIVAGNPFPQEIRRDPSHVLAMPLKTHPTPAAFAALRVAVPGRERVALGERTLYIYYPAGIAESKLRAALIERHLATRGTARNWNTVLKIRAALASMR